MQDSILHYTWMENIGAPARNTLLYHGIDTLEKLSAFTEKEILKLHGMGKASIPTLDTALKLNGLKFKDEQKKIDRLIVCKAVF